MTGDELPDTEQVVRYVRPSHILENGRVAGRAFRLRVGEEGLSVNWLGYFAELSKPEQVREVRRLIRMTLRGNGRFAELNVGAVKQAVSADLPELPGLHFVHYPLPADGASDADPSHSQVSGLPPFSDLSSKVIGALIARRVQELHPASG